MFRCRSRFPSGWFGLMLMSVIAFSLQVLTTQILFAEESKKLVRPRKTVETEILNVYPKFDIRITAMRFSPNSKLLAVASSDNIVKLLDPKTREIKAEFKEHEGWITSIVFTPDGKKLITAGRDRKVFIWDIKAKKVIGKFEGNGSLVQDLGITPDGKIILGISSNGQIRFWKTATQESVRTVKHNTSRSSAAVRSTGNFISRDGKTAVSVSASGSSYGFISRISIESGAQYGRKTTSQRYQKMLACSSPSKDKFIVAISGPTSQGSQRNTCEIKLFNAAKGDSISTLPSQFASHGIFAIQPKGKLIAAPNSKNVLELWNIDSKKIDKDLNNKSNPIYPGSRYMRLRFSPDGNLLAEAGRKSLQVWSLSQKPLPFDLLATEKNQLKTAKIFEELRELGGKIEFQDNDKKKPAQFIDMIDSDCTNENLSHLASQVTLTRLDLTRTHVSDKGLVHLEKMVNLKHLFLCGCKVSDDALKRLQTKLPKTKIFR